MLLLCPRSHATAFYCLCLTSVTCSRVCLLRIVPVGVTNCTARRLPLGGRDSPSRCLWSPACCLHWHQYMDYHLFSYELYSLVMPCIADYFYIHVCLNKRNATSPFKVQISCWVVNCEHAFSRWKDPLRKPNKN